MLLYQQRVVNEKNDLDAKISKLVQFTKGNVFAGLKREDSELLLLQLEHMKAYSDVLDRRIDRFVK